MKSSIISWFASRYLLKKEASSFISLISWISIIGIMIAVGVLIVVLSVVNGFEKELESKLPKPIFDQTTFPLMMEEDLHQKHHVLQQLAHMN